MIEEREVDNTGQISRGDDDGAHAIRLVGRVVASVVHEIRNPLTGAYGYAQLIRDLAEPPFGEYADRILGELERIRRYLKQLSHLAPRDVAALSSQWSLRQIVEDAVAGIPPDRLNGDVVFSIEVSGEHYVWGFHIELVLAVRATLTNALDSLDGKKEILVTSEIADDVTRLRICNTGTPISPRALPRVCEPFFSTEEGKRGLGLAVVKRVMTDHNGTVEVENDSDQVCVTLAFPVLSQNTQIQAARQGKALM